MGLGFGTALSISRSVRLLLLNQREIAPGWHYARACAGLNVLWGPGAALKVVADDETGELEGVTILWGEVSDDFAESLPG